MKGLITKLIFLFFSSFGILTGGDFTDHGVAAPVATNRAVVATVNDANERIVVIWLMDHTRRDVLTVNVDSGASTLHPLPFDTSDSPFYFILGSNNRLYSMLGHYFTEFDPEAGAFSFHERASSSDPRAFSMAEDAQGNIWMATHPNSQLIRFDPKTRHLKNFGSFTKEKWKQMPRHMAIGPNGWIYVGSGNQESFVVAFNPETGESRYPLPEQERRPGERGRVYLGVDGQVYGYGNWDQNRNWYRFENGEASRIEAPRPEEAKLPKGPQNEMIVEFPDGSKIEELSTPDRWIEVREPDGSLRRVTFDYASQGVRIESIAPGPDGEVFGSTRHPLRIFNFNPESETLSNSGLLNRRGHWNAITGADGLLYGGEYSNGKLLQYDPDTPWKPADPVSPNPRKIMEAAPTINRPHAILHVLETDQLLLTGTPGYGLTGGGMVIYDTQSRSWQILADSELIPNQSTTALVALPGGLVLGGTTIQPGKGGEQIAKEAELYLFNPDSPLVLTRKVPVPDKHQIQDLLLGPNGLVHAIAVDSHHGGLNPVFFVFDPKTMETVHTEAMGQQYGNAAGRQAPRILARGPGGLIFALFERSIVEIDSGDLTHRLAASLPVQAEAGIAVIQGRLYFSSGSHLWSWKIPEN